MFAFGIFAWVVSPQYLWHQTITNQIKFIIVKLQTEWCYIVEGGYTINS